MTSLRDLPVGDVGILADPQVPARLATRLAELGLRAGARVQVLQRAVGGARVLSVTGSRIAVDARTAAALQVRVEHP